jgi:hypothetical protein
VSVHDFFSGDRIYLEGLSNYFDNLDNRVRISEARSLTAREQALLFDQAVGFRPLTLKDFIPETLSPLHQVIHYGRNSLPVFKIFEKRFCRPDRKGPTDALWGYNEQPLKGITGPGYFVARQANELEVVIDYCEVPPRKPKDWPTILPNSSRLSRFIYYQTRDYVRGVSKHVSIGRATRQGKPMDNWFVLCRDDSRG